MGLFLTTGRIDSSFLYHGAYLNGWINNIGLSVGTTAYPNDSISIISASGSSLSPINPGWLGLSSSTHGELGALSVTSDITIDLTGAHWGYGTTGDLTDFILFVYAINDSGTLKWGISPFYGLTIISGSNDETAGTSVTTVDDVLVNSALSGDSECLRIGWFKANFDDTGGLSEDIWSVQNSDLEDINVGTRPSGYLLREVYSLNDTPTLASSWTNNYYFTTSTYGTDRGRLVYTYSSNTTNGDSVTINKAGLYSISLMVDITHGTTNTGIQESVIKNQTNSSNGDQILTYDSTLNVTSGTDTVRASVGKLEWLDVGDTLHIRRTTVTGGPTVNDLTLFLDNVTK